MPIMKESESMCRTCGCALSFGAVAAECVMHTVATSSKPILDLIMSIANEGRNNNHGKVVHQMMNSAILDELMVHHQI
eukprot:1442054-Ditylum_brightwellii.AAC.1